MASKLTCLLLTLSLFTAVVVAVDFDYTKEELQFLLDFAEDGDKSNAASTIVKRGGGKRIIRCTHSDNGALCVCDRRYKRNKQKYYLLCVGQGAGNI